MHKSLLGTVVIDCETAQLDTAAAFWSAALGWRSMELSDPSDANYRRLDTPDGEVHVLVQAVDHESRVHIDIETDDVEAEVARLEKLGARRVAQVKRWWVMRLLPGNASVWSGSVVILAKGEMVRNASRSRARRLDILATPRCANAQSSRRPWPEGPDQRIVRATG